MNLLILLAGIYTSFAWGASEGPQAVVEAIFAKAAQPAVAKDPALQGEINQLVDFDKLAKSALGKQAVSAADRAWFRDTLREILTLTVYPKAPEFLGGVKISYAQTEEKGNAATVKSTVQNKADLTDVHYRLEKGPAGWRVVDISIAGLSWVDSIRDQVRDTVKKKKWKGLKEAMSRRLADLRAGA